MNVHHLTTFLACSLTLLYVLLLALWFLTVEIGFNVQLTLLFIWLWLLAGGVGLILKKDWGRRFVIGGSTAALVYIVVDFLALTRRTDTVTIGLTLVFLLTIFFFRWSGIRPLYQKGGALSGRRILIIDDDRTFLKLLRSHLVKEGMGVLTAETGEEGLDTAQRHAPDLIVLDVILPGIKGQEVCRRLKDDTRTREIPVIFLTVKNSPDDVAGEMEAGGIFHMSKPVNMSEVGREIKKILGN